MSYKYYKWKRSSHIWSNFSSSCWGFNGIFFSGCSLQLLKLLHHCEGHLYSLCTVHIYDLYHIHITYCIATKTRLLQCVFFLCKIQNYNKSRIHSFRGARDAEITLDGGLIFQGEIARYNGEKNTADLLKQISYGHGLINWSTNQAPIPPQPHSTPQPTSAPLYPPAQHHSSHFPPAPSLCL